MPAPSSVRGCGTGQQPGADGLLCCGSADSGSTFYVRLLYPERSAAVAAGAIAMGVSAGAVLGNLRDLMGPQLVGMQNPDPEAR